jgi:hypothetical protein
LARHVTGFLQQLALGAGKQRFARIDLARRQLDEARRNG